MLVASSSVMKSMTVWLWALAWFIAGAFAMSAIRMGSDLVVENIDAGSHSEACEHSTHAGTGVI